MRGDDSKNFGDDNKEREDGNREQGTGNREQGTGNREQGGLVTVLSLDKSAHDSALRLKTVFHYLNRSCDTASATSGPSIVYRADSKRSDRSVISLCSYCMKNTEATG